MRARWLQVHDWEERANVLSHGLGAVLSVVGSFLLLAHLKSAFSLWQIVALLVFCLSMVCLYLFSTLYHASSNARRKTRLHVFDHASIYAFIAGTYTVYCSISASESAARLLGTVWLLALLGILSKIFWTRPHSYLSTLLYLALGWIIWVHRDVYLQIPASSRPWLFYGGLSYSFGCLFYQWRGLRFHHSIWHLWVLLGSLLHFMGIWVQVVPV